MSWMAEGISEAQMKRWRLGRRFPSSIKELARIAAESNVPVTKLSHGYAPADIEPLDHSIAYTVTGGRDGCRCINPFGER